MIDIDKLTPGILVRIISLDKKKKYPFGWNYENKMDHWCGQIMTVKRVVVAEDFVNMEEDADEFSPDGWHWYPEMIQVLIHLKRYFPPQPDGLTRLERFFQPLL